METGKNWKRVKKERRRKNEDRNRSNAKENLHYATQSAMKIKPAVDGSCQTRLLKACEI